MKWLELTNLVTHMTLDLLVSTIAITLGVFITVVPQRAAEIWGSHRLHSLAPKQQISFVRWYRVFGILLFLGGVLFAIDSLVFYSMGH
jgi:hypothetical protein